MVGGCALLGSGKFWRNSRGGGDPDSSLWGNINNNGLARPTFGPFCDIYILLVAAEDLDSVLSKGDTLKEMD
jgi:hypothetical protein